MSALSSHRLRSLLPGLGWAVLLHGACEAYRMGLPVFVLFALLVLALGVRWGGGSDRALQAAREWSTRGPALSLARSTWKGEPQPYREQPFPRKAPALPARRTFWSKVKLTLGGAGLLLCGLWWLLVTAMLFTPDPAPALDGLFLNSSLKLIAISLLLTVLFLVIVRSGLRGPADPLAPSRSDPRVLGSPLPPRVSAEGRYPGPRGTLHKKPHLRLVRPAP